MRGFKYGKLISLIPLSHVVKGGSVIRAGVARHYQQSLTKAKFSHSCIETTLTQSNTEISLYDKLLSKCLKKV